MKIAYYIGGEHHTPLKHYARQLGVKYAVSSTCTPKGNPYSPHTGPWDFMPMLKTKRELEDFGMEWKVYEGVSFIDEAKLGTENRDLAIDRFCRLLENMSKLGIETVCYNWMPVWSWYRSRTEVILPGGAVATGFNLHDVQNAADCGIVISKEQLWTNLEYFLKKVVPVAEKNKIRLAVHPDDPPVNSIAGIERILTSAEAMREVTKLVPSEYNGITLCQGTFAAMGENVEECIELFGKDKTLFFAHFRDIEGTAENFYETFHHAGKTDMYRALKKYYDIGFEGLIRPDHVPTMYGDDNSNPAYGILGNLVATGYMFGLCEAIEKEEK